MPRTITNLRYLKRDLLVSEQQLQRNYYRELIHSFGCDVSYFRHDATPYEEPSAVNYDYTYGESTTMSYWLSAPIVVFMESMGDAAILNKFGIETDGDMDAFILIDDFTEQFRDLIGTGVTRSFTDITISGLVSAGTGTISGSFANSELSGYTSAVISGLTSGVVSGVYNETPIRIAKKHMDLVYRSSEYEDRLIEGTLSGNWSGTLDLTGTGNISATISGDLDYRIEDPGKLGGPSWKISPQVGDFFRLDFHEDNAEEYEITRIIDKNLQTDGINPLLSKYVWHLTCVKRDPSYENVVGDLIGGSVEEEFTKSKIESNYRIEDESDEIFDYETSAVNIYDGVNSDSIYGDYGITEL